MALKEFTDHINDWVEQIMKNTRNLSTELELREQAKVALQLFLDADTNNEGTLDSEELKHLCEHAGLPMESDEEEMLIKIDADGNGSLNIAEWSKWW